MEQVSDRASATGSISMNVSRIHHAIRDCRAAAMMAVLRKPSGAGHAARRLDRPRPRGRLSSEAIAPVPLPGFRRLPDGSTRFPHFLCRAADAMRRTKRVRRERQSCRQGYRPRGRRAQAAPSLRSASCRMAHAAAGLLLVVAGLLVVPAAAQAQEVRILWSATWRGRGLPPVFSGRRASERAATAGTTHSPKPRYRWMMKPAGP